MLTSPTNKFPKESYDWLNDYILL